MRRSTTIRFMLLILLCLGGAGMGAEGDDTLADQYFRATIAQRIEQGKIRDAEGGYHSNDAIFIELQKKYEKADTRLTVPDRRKFIAMCLNDLIPKFREAQEKDPAMLDLKNKGLVLLASLLSEGTDPETFQLCRDFWLEDRFAERTAHAAAIKAALGRQWATVDNIKLYCLLPLDVGEKRALLGFLDQNIAWREQGDDEYLALRARIGDAKAETDLLSRFHKVKVGYKNYRDVAGFKQLKQLVGWLAYAGTPKAEAALVDLLPTDIQGIDGLATESIRRQVLLSWAFARRDAFMQMFRLPMDSWMETYGDVRKFYFERQQIPEGEDPESLGRFEVFCQDKFGRLPWKREDVWFYFALMIPSLPPGADIEAIRHEFPRPPYVGPGRAISKAEDRFPAPVNANPGQ